MNKLQAYSVIILTVLTLSCKKNSNNNFPDIQQNQDTIVSLENDKIKLTYSLLGGSLSEFQDKKTRLNPFTWKLSEDEMPENNKKGAVFQGHFLCVGRWGIPTSGEVKLGMPDNGESSNNWWKLDSRNAYDKLKMSCEAPLDGFTINREVKLSTIDPLMKVVETYTNDLSICRTITIVQHATIGPPFFDKDLVMNSNATYGFNQALVQYGLNKYEYTWPHINIDTLHISTLDITRSNTKVQYISTYIFSDSIGWITTFNPSLKLIFGYTWKTKDYPWLTIWNGLKNEKLSAKGIFFGNTGLGDKSSFEDRIIQTFHKVKNFEVIDAKMSSSKTYFCFFMSVPEHYQKTLSVLYENDQVTIKILTSTGIKTYKLTL
jgi:hypothetical protein